MVGGFREPQAGECNTPIETTQLTKNKAGVMAL